jgi:hypothetical protein
MAERQGRACKNGQNLGRRKKGGYKKEKKQGGICDFIFFSFPTFVIYHVSPLLVYNYWFGYRGIKLDNGWAK